MATLVLRNVKGSPLTNTEVDNNFSNINNELGVVSNLSTTAKANLVAAINELATSSSVSNGTVSNVTLDIKVVDDTSSNSTVFPTFVAASSGNAAVKITSTKLTFNPSTGLLTSTDYNSSSDVTLKDNIEPITNPLDILSQITGYSFTWKDSGEKSLGLSAQEVEKILPEVVKNRPDGTKGINYLNFIAILIESIKHLKQEVQMLKDKK